MSPDNNHIPPAEAAGAVDQATQEEKRIAARRRFLRLGSGSAALVVTIPHRRAFAAKKGVLASNCASLAGTPDLISAKEKKALEVSAMGTPKGAICRPRATPNVPPVGSCAPTMTQSKYFTAGGQKVFIADPHELEKGCGTVEATMAASKNYRLYQKGYCPIIYNPNALNGLSLDISAKYFKSDGTMKACKF